MANVTGTVASAPDQSAALVTNIIQAGVFVALGPFICVFGPAIIHITMLIRSLFAMNYLSFIGSVSSVNRMTAFSVFTDQLAVLAVGTLSMTIASLKAARLRAYTSGAVLGTMIATPLVALLRQTLYFGYVGCTGYGEKTPMFPDGEPTGCDPESQEYQITFQLTKALTVAIVSAMALLGTKTMGFSIAMMGATMLISGGVDLAKSILLQVTDPAIAVDLDSTVKAIQMPVTYGIAGLGYLCQWMILKPKRDDRNPDPYLPDPACDTEKDLQMKGELAAIDPYAQVGFIKFFKAVIKKQTLQRKIKKAWWKGYREKKEESLIAGAPPPVIKKFTPPYMVPMDPETDACTKMAPFKFFRWMVGGKWDDRIAHLDHMLAKLLLADDASDPKELQNNIKAMVKAWAKRAAKKQVAEAKAKVTGSAKKLTEAPAATSDTAQTVTV